MKRFLSNLILLIAVFAFQQTLTASVPQQKQIVYLAENTVMPIHTDATNAVSSPSLYLNQGKYLADNSIIQDYGTRYLADNSTIKQNESNTIVEPTETITDTSKTVSVPKTNITVKDLLLNNWQAILMALIAFWEVIARLTPTTKDDTFLNILQTFLDKILPNFQKGGGVH